MSWYLEVLKKYAVFTGRARRKEFWYFALFNFLAGIALGVIEGLLGLFPESRQSILVMLYNLAVLLPSLGVTVRRLHDTGRSGWWMLITFVPLILVIPVLILAPPVLLLIALVLFVGSLVLLVFTVQDSDPGQNEYGANPKEIAG